MDSGDTNTGGSFGGDIPPTLGSGYFYNPGDGEADPAVLTHIPSSVTPELLLQDSMAAPGDSNGGGDSFATNYSQPQSGEAEEEEVYIPTGEEVTGRWTKEEHELFLQALKKYGKVRSPVGPVPGSC